MLRNGLNFSLFPLEDLSVMGFAEVVPRFFLIKKRILETVKEIYRFRPDVLVTIDSKGFHSRMIRSLRKGKI